MAALPESRPSGSRSPFNASLFLAWTWIFIGLMCYHWNAWPNCSILFGPFFIVRYNGLDLGTSVGTCVLLSILFAYPIRPSVFTAIASAIGFLLWLFAGLIGEGVGR